VLVGLGKQKICLVFYEKNKKDAQKRGNSPIKVPALKLENKTKPNS